MLPRAILLKGAVMNQLPSFPENDIFIWENYKWTGKHLLDNEWGRKGLDELCSVIPHDWRDLRSAIKMQSNENQASGETVFVLSFPMWNTFNVSGGDCHMTFDTV